MESYLTGLECTRCDKAYSPDMPENLCACGAPLFAKYDLQTIAGRVARADFSYRVHSLWRFKELLPVRQPENIVTLQEGFTPLHPAAKAGAEIGLKKLFLKDETSNPTGSFKARGLAVAVSKAKELGVTEICLPTAGNAGGAASAYSARAGIKCHVFMPDDTPDVFVNECREYGADVRMVRGFITDAARVMQAEAKNNNWFEVSTLKEPYRVEGKKTILLELAQQFFWNLPDVILFPTGGGTGIIGAWKALNELKELRWVPRSKNVRLIAVQASGCAPVVRAFEQNLDHAPAWENPQTRAWGLRVPRAIADFLILRAIRDSGGTAISVTEEEMTSAQSMLAGKEGLFVSLEAAAPVAALPYLIRANLVTEEESVVILLTGSGLKS